VKSKTDEFINYTKIYKQADNCIIATYRTCQLLLCEMCKETNNDDKSVRQRWTLQVTGKCD